jgi:putative RNA 2'-phosphotransferase
MELAMTTVFPDGAPESSMDQKERTRVSKFLSLVLRHQPDTIGLELDPQGWVAVDDLIRRAGAHGRRLTRAMIEEVVATNDKQRFSLSADRSKIRARQGHSIPVDLGLEPVKPPPVLFHGTATRFLESILREGLEPSGRQHVHLSPDEETVVRVGRRHGKPVVLRIDAAGMDAAGHRFYLSENGVWLTDTVPPRFVTVLAGEAGH